MKRKRLVVKVGDEISCSEALFGTRSTGPWALVKHKDPDHPWKYIQFWVKNPTAIKDYDEMRILSIERVYIDTTKNGDRYFDRYNADVVVEGTKRRNAGDVLDKMLEKHGR